MQSNKKEMSLQHSGSKRCLFFSLFHKVWLDGMMKMRIVVDVFILDTSSAKFHKMKLEITGKTMLH